MKRELLLEKLRNSFINELSYGENKKSNKLKKNDNNAKKNVKKNKVSDK